jgi:GT2 family glycosyltransferase
MNPEISVLVVHYFAEALLPRLFGSMGDFFASRASEILIWDNGGRNGRVDLAAPGPMTWFPSAVNVGFAEGHNALAKRAQGRRFLIINPDAEFAPGGLEKLREAAEKNPQAGLVAPRIQFPDGRLQVSVFPPYGFGFDLRKSFWLEHRTSFSGAQREIRQKLSEAREPFPVGWVSGACMLVSREAWEKVGGFDPNFFFGGEDADLCQRMREAGFEILCEPRALLIHQAGQSSKQEPERKILFYYQKRMYYAYKHFSRLQYGILWLASVVELALKWKVGLFFSLFSSRWRRKRKGYAGALALVFFGRWRNTDRLIQKRGEEMRKPVEAAV